MVGEHRLAVVHSKSEHQTTRGLFLIGKWPTIGLRDGICEKDVAVQSSFVDDCFLLDSCENMQNEHWERTA